MIKRETINNDFLIGLIESRPQAGYNHITIFSNQEYLRDILLVCVKTYYGFSTIYYDDYNGTLTENEMYSQFWSKILQGINPYMTLLKDMDRYGVLSDITKSIVKDGRKNDTFNENKSDSSTDTRKQTNSGSDTYANTEDTKSMTEASPINATLGDIVTPNSKVNNNDVANGSTNYGKVITNNDTSSKSASNSGTNTHNYDDVISDPNIYAKYLEIMKEYNIYDIFLKAFERIVYIKSAYI